VSRSQFYAMKRAYELYGKEGLAPRVRRKPAMPNRTPAQLEEQILMQTRQNPLMSYLRLAGTMSSGGGQVTPTMVRYVWQRHGLSTQSARRAWARLTGGRSELEGLPAVNKRPGESREGDASHHVTQEQPTVEP
jgi:hypothetical protein